MRYSTKSGITLVEVIAGLSLMGTLLTVILVSSSQHLRQLTAAEKKRASVRMLDNFLASWSVSDFDVARIPDAVRRSGLAVVGQFGAHGVEGDQSHEFPNYQVELRRMRRSEFNGGSVVRLTVTSTNTTGERHPTAWAEVMVPEQ